MAIDSTSQPAASRELTGEEAAVYDRQIRLWGLAAQRRLAASTVLITGACNSMLAQELAKNVVLAGIAELTLCVPPGASAGDGGFLGHSVADSAASLQDINPLVSVKTVEGDSETGPDPSSFSLVCAVDCPEAHERATAEACRSAGVPFMCGCAPGPVGFFFMDLGSEYKYTVQTKLKKDAGAPEVKGKGTEAEMIEAENVCSYKSLADAMDAPWGTEVKRSDCGWHVAGCLRAFEQAHNRLPGGEEGDVAALEAIYAKLQIERNAARTNEELMKDLGATACYVLPPVAAVVGGMWGREAIKSVSRREEPLNNFFFYSSRTSMGSVVNV